MDVITSLLNAQQPPDFNISADRGPYLVIICSAMIALSGVAALLRLLYRRPSISSSWDDWLLFVALVSDMEPYIQAVEADCEQSRFPGLLAFLPLSVRIK